MPKLKTHSGAKKRFKWSATGKLMHKGAGLRHGLSKRSQDMKRAARRMQPMDPCDVQVIRHFLPYGRKKRAAKRSTS